VFVSINALTDSPIHKLLVCLIYFLDQLFREDIFNEVKINSSQNDAETFFLEGVSFVVHRVNAVTNSGAHATTVRARGCV
jgi:hypothetical protein